MHAQRIIQDLLADECPSMHAKRRAGVADMAQAGCAGGLNLMGMSRVVDGAASIRHRLKRCDRLLSNDQLAQEKPLIYGAMARRLLDGMGYAWIGRIRNRDMARPASDDHDWRGCKTLYAQATGDPQDLGPFHYVRSRPVACRLVLVKKQPKGRHRTTVHKKRARSAHSQKQAKAHKEPWLLAVSPQLAALSAQAVVAIYGGRMQIEQTFRDVKNPRWGLGLSESQTRKPKRLAILLLLGALACYALWLMGLAVRANGYRIEYGSRNKAATALSIISLARWWAAENPTAMLSRRQLHAALALLRSMALAI